MENAMHTEAQIKGSKISSKHQLDALRFAFQLTPQETDIMGLLVSNRVVSPEAIAQRLGIATEVRVAIYRLRNTLRRFNIEIYSKRRFGYWLDDEAKSLIKAKTTPLLEVAE